MGLNNMTLFAMSPRKTKNNVLVILLMLFLYIGLTFTLWKLSQILTDGNTHYPLDDTYIHMAMARHFATSGRWSVDLTNFTSSSSSPFWTLILAGAYRLLGIQHWLPFGLNLAIGSIALIVAYQLLASRARTLELIVFGTCIIVFTPLPVLTLLGMEHTLHALLTVAILWMGSSYIAQKMAKPFVRFSFLALCALLPIVRYEGFFLLFWIVVALLFQRRWTDEFLVSMAGVSLVTAYGLISISHGWSFLPNTVFLKGRADLSSITDWLRFWGVGIAQLSQEPYLYSLILGILLAFLINKRNGSINYSQQLRVYLYIGMFLLHLQFAKLGWFFRYEAYLIFSGSVILMELANSWLGVLREKTSLRLDYSSVTAVAIVIVLFIPLLYRGGKAMALSPLAVKNIYEQQVQMGRFIAQFYRGRTIAANDIGAINYYADIYLLDLFGLASLEMTDLKINHKLSAEAIDRLVRQKSADLIVIYPSWFEDVLPSNWIATGSWVIENNVVCSSDLVTFYALNSSQVPIIAKNLKSFSRLLPGTIKQSGIYTELP